MKPNFYNDLWDWVCNDSGQCLVLYRVAVMDPDGGGAWEGWDVTLPATGFRCLSVTVLAFGGVCGLAEDVMLDGLSTP